MKRKSVSFIIGIVVIVILIANFKMFALMNRMNQDIRNISNVVMNLDRNINSIESKVYNSLNRLVEEKKWLYDVDYNINDISKDLKEVSITLSWSVRELKKDDRVYLLYGTENEGNHGVSEWKEMIADDLGNLSYNVNLTLPFQENYQFKVLAKNDNSSTSQRLTEVDFLNMLNSKLDIEVNPSEKMVRDNHVNIKFNVSIRNQYNLNFRGLAYKNIDENLLKIKNVKIKVYSSEDLKKEIDIYKDGKIVAEEAQYKEPFKHDRDMKMEEIKYEKSLKYDSVPDSYEVIEVVVEDFLGRSYSKKSHDI